MTIHRLPAQLRDLIAAGEVVQKPANVLKELVENAIDAGATSIVVRAEEGGIVRIEVADNGVGIARDDLFLAVENHATSKIAQADDLQRIGTLGFRGEALASIRACARLHVHSRVAGEDEGWILHCHPDGSVEEPRPQARAQGTTITVENLFGTLPARRKFLKSPRTEQGRLRQVLEQLMLAWPQVGFRFDHNGKTVVDAPGADRRGRTMLWLGEKSAGNLIEAREEGPLFSVEMLGAQPAFTSTRADQIQLLVNGRPIQDRGLVHAVIEGYSRWIPPGRFPQVVCYLQVDPAWVDVNVHPSKIEVRFTEPRLLHDFVLKTLRRTLTEKAGFPAHAGALPQARSGPVAPLPFLTRRYAESKDGDTRHRTPIPSGRHYPSDGDPGHELRSPPISSHELQAVLSVAEGEQGQPGSIRILGQIMAKYIVAEVEGALWVVDQHAAHEALNYERIRQAVLRGISGQTQLLLVPTELLVSEEGAERLQAAAESWRALGYVLEIKGDGTVLMQGVPDWSSVDNEVFIADLAEQLCLGQTSVADGAPLVLWAAERACKASVRANTRLGMNMMHHLLESLLALPEGAACPHGRPTRLFWTEQELDRMIQRQGHD